MTVKEVYEQSCGNYEEVLSRLGNEDRILRFVKKFFETGDMESLTKAITEKDGNNAFEYAHRLKGNSLNIGFTNMSQIIDKLVEPLRCREIKDAAMIDELYKNVFTEYDKTKNLVSQL